MVKHYDPTDIKVFFEGEELKAPAFETYLEPYPVSKAGLAYEPSRAYLFLNDGRHRPDLRSEIDPKTGDMVTVPNPDYNPLEELRKAHEAVTKAITPKHNIPITGTSGLSLALGFRVKAIDLLTEESPYGPPRQYLYISFISRDRETGKPIELTFSALLPPNIAEIELPTYIRRELLKLCEHELDEGLRMHGKQLRDPHVGEYRPEQIRYNLCYYCNGSGVSQLHSQPMCYVCCGTGRI